MYSFDALEFAGWMRARWSVIAISCGVAVLVAVISSLAQPSRYTATATLIIQPPGGNDPRAALAVSSVYLESLKIYERFALSDTLFLRAMDHVHIREGSSGSAESLKSQTLKVSKPSGVALLEISATRKDPREAQALVRYIAEQTVELNQSLIAQSSQDIAAAYSTQLNAARERMERALQAQTAFAASRPVESLENEVQGVLDLQYSLQRDLARARADLANASAGNKDDEFLAGQIASANARIIVLDTQIRELTGRLEKQGSQLEVRKAGRELLDIELRAARGAWESATNKLNDAFSSSQLRGERLQILDPGTVPQSPSSPNMRLNVLAAIIISFAGSLMYLAFRFTNTRLIHARAEFTHSLR